MIETFKIIRKIYDEETAPKLTPSSTEYKRDHQHKLLKYCVRYTPGHIGELSSGS